jgi:lysine-ketoglutarate reductase/saccharopine dehydrogenase-like protein (TIGR00300 family)
MTPNGYNSIKENCIGGVRLFRRTVELKGHIVDSKILTKVFEKVEGLGGEIFIEHSVIGRTKADPSYIIMEVSAPTEDILQKVVQVVTDLGGSVMEEAKVLLIPAPDDGVFPENFYSTTNLPTFIWYNQSWLKVDNIEMDCAIVVEEGEVPKAYCVPISRIKKDQKVVVGKSGVKVLAFEESSEKEIFSFMGSEVSSEKPKDLVIKNIAALMKGIKDRNGKILIVLGPAVIHTGAGKWVERLIEGGFIDVIFAGNAVATHDVEAAFFGTSLGINLETGKPVPEGHSHHLRAINRIRAAGSIKEAVSKNILTKGLMYTAVKHNVDYVLAGSIRDDGPMPDVITDVIKAQELMRSKLEGVEMALMVSSMLHSIATGNLLPASVKAICVDINPAVVTKLADRGSFQTIGLVSDVELFLRQLTEYLQINKK